MPRFFVSRHNLGGYSGLEQSIYIYTGCKVWKFSKEMAVKSLKESFGSQTHFGFKNMEFKMKRFSFTAICFCWNSQTYTLYYYIWSSPQRHHIQDHKQGRQQKADWRSRWWSMTKNAAREFYPKEWFESQFLYSFELDKGGQNLDVLEKKRWPPVQLF